MNICCDLSCCKEVRPRIRSISVDSVVGATYVCLVSPTRLVVACVIGPGEILYDLVNAPYSASVHRSKLILLLVCSVSSSGSMCCESESLGIISVDP
jgi:hypothetical protein